MRVLNIFAALSAIVALAALTYAAHELNDYAYALPGERMKMGGLIQLGAAAAGFAIANRTGMLNLIGGALILTGAALFAGVMYALAFDANFGATILAPVGGISLLLGFLTLAFAKPRA